MQYQPQRKTKSSFARGRTERLIEQRISDIESSSDLVSHSSPNTSPYTRAFLSASVQMRIEGSIEV